MNKMLYINKKMDLVLSIRRPKNKTNDIVKIELIYKGHKKRFISENSTHYKIFQYKEWDLKNHMVVFEPNEATDDIIAFLEDIAEPHYDEHFKQMCDEILAKQDEEEDTVIDILAHTTKVINYEAAGVDVYIQDKVFRLQDEDFISAKNFQIWYRSNFKTSAALQKGDWTALVGAWLKMSEDDLSGDALAPPVMEEMVHNVVRNAIYTDFSEEVQKKLDMGMPVFVLKDNQLYTPTKVFTNIMTKLELSRRKMRQYIEHFLQYKNSRVLRLGDKTTRFWVFKFDKMQQYWPELKKQKVITPDNKVTVVNELNLGEVNTQFEQYLDTGNVEKLWGYLALRGKDNVDQLTLEEKREFIQHYTQPMMPYQEKVIKNV